MLERCGKFLAVWMPSLAMVMLAVSCGQAGDGYTVSDEGIVSSGDNAGVQWKAMADSAVTWLEASYYADTLSLDGGGWRLPTLEELSMLKTDGRSQCNLPSSFACTGWFLWSGEEDGGQSAWGIELQDGAGYSARHVDCEYSDARAILIRTTASGG